MPPIGVGLEDRDQLELTDSRGGGPSKVRRLRVEAPVHPASHLADDAPELEGEAARLGADRAQRRADGWSGANRDHPAPAAAAGPRSDPEQPEIAGELCRTGFAGAPDLEVRLAVRPYEPSGPEKGAEQPVSRAARACRRGIDHRRLDADQHVLRAPCRIHPRDVGGDAVGVERLDRGANRDRPGGADHPRRRGDQRHALDERPPAAREQRGVRSELRDDPMREGLGAVHGMNR